MGEAQNQPFQLSFNPALKVEFQGSRVTSDGGLILVRGMDQRLGFSDLIAQHITDPRGKNTQFPLTDLVRQSVYRRLAGYEDVNDAEPLTHDPTFRLISSETLWERGTALTSLNRKITSGLARGTTHWKAYGRRQYERDSPSTSGARTILIRGRLHSYMGLRSLPCYQLFWGNPSTWSNQLPLLILGAATGF